MKLPTARTRDEANLWLDLTPCDDCGSSDTDWQHGQALVDGELVSAYDGTCTECGKKREYFFALPAKEVAGPFPNFGGPEPSDLLDPGRWLSLADQLTTNLPTHDPDASAQAQRIAAAAIAEILKFNPPTANAVPEDAFWSPEGRRVYAADPARFDRTRLQIAYDTYSSS